MKRAAELLLISIGVTFILLCILAVVQSIITGAPA